MSETQDPMTTTTEAVEAAKNFAENIGHDGSQFDCIRTLYARVRELELERQLFVDVINGVLASATSTQKENPAMFAAWAACQSALMDKHPQPEQAKQADEVLYGLEGQELLDDDLDEIVSRILENYSQRPRESFDVVADRIPWPVKVFKFRRVKVSDSDKNRMSEWALENAIEWLNEDYSGPDGVSTNPTAPMQLAARRFVDEVVQHYKVWNCEPTGEVTEITREQAKEIAG